MVCERVSARTIAPQRAGMALFSEGISGPARGLTTERFRTTGSLRRAALVVSQQVTQALVADDLSQAGNRLQAR